VLPRMTTAKLVLDGRKGDRRTGEVIRAWFDRCWTLVGAQFAESLLTDPLPEADIREEVSVGMSYLHYPGRGHPFASMVISPEQEGYVDDGSDVPFNRTWTPRAWAEFLDRVTATPRGAVVRGGIVEPHESGIDNKGWPHLIITTFIGAPDGCVRLYVQATTDHVFPKSGPGGLLTALRTVADLGDPRYGEIVFEEHGARGETQLESALHLMAHEGNMRAREVLRGYAWLTIVPRELADRLGGPGAMRATGAFAEVEQLASGGLWLRATEHPREYDYAAAERVFHAVRSVLPAGLPKERHPLLVHADAQASTSGDVR
jgi:hypothetical protein